MQGGGWVATGTPGFLNPESWVGGGGCLRHSPLFHTPKGGWAERTQPRGDPAVGQTPPPRKGHPPPPKGPRHLGKPMGGPRVQGDTGCHQFTTFPEITRSTEPGKSLGPGGLGPFPDAWVHSRPWGGRFVRQRIGVGAAPDAWVHCTSVCQPAGHPGATQGGDPGVRAPTGGTQVSGHPTRGSRCPGTHGGDPGVRRPSHS